MKTIRARLVARPAEVVLGRDVAPVSLQAVPRFQLVGGILWRLDDALARAASRAVGVSSEARLLAATPDLAYFVAVERDAIVVGGQTVATGAADSAAFVAGGRALVTAPSASGHDHEVLLVDVTSGAVVDRAMLDTYDATASATPHPADGTVLFDLAEGQDGSNTFAVRVVDDRLEVEHVLANVVTASFSPNGDRLLTMPHLEADAQLFSWPPLERLAALDAAAAGVDGDFDFFGCFVGSDRILLQVRDGPTLLCDGRLSPAALVEYEGLPANAEHSALEGVSEVRFATVTWVGSDSATYVWEL